MATKVEAAFIAAHAGVPVVVTSTAQAAAALAGERVGTLFAPDWAAGPAPGSSGCATPAARAAGCCSTRARCGRSASGTPPCSPRASPAWPATSSPTTRSSWSGPDGVVVARGLVAYDARELPALLGRKTGDLPPEYRREVVHRDEMVLVGPPGRAG